jgi:hypothetical protein
MDGLSAGSNCQIPLFRGSTVFKAFMLKAEMSNGIPDCLYSLRLLQTLHLSGNGFTGSLNDDVFISNALNDLVLSYNRLSGSIPVNFGNNYWVRLDLSYNRITGGVTAFTNFSNTETSILFK